MEFSSFSLIRMSRQEKKIELRTVDDEGTATVPVVRLNNEESGSSVVRPLYTEIPDSILISKRLDVPAHEAQKLRSHEPDIGVLLDAFESQQQIYEDPWGAKNNPKSPPTWLRFGTLLLVTLSGILGTIIYQTRDRGDASELSGLPATSRRKSTLHDAEAILLVTQIEHAIQNYFKATSVSEKSRYVRHRERVQPLMERFYADKIIEPLQLQSRGVLQPLTLDREGEFWLYIVDVSNQDRNHLIVEITESGDAKIDWESLVSYQPLPWDKFTSERPIGVSYDFRVYAEPDYFHTDEFADSSVWDCYRLTAVDGDAPLFGYIKNSESSAQNFSSQFDTQNPQPIPVILRLTFPEGAKNLVAVKIEEIVSSGWMYLENSKN